MPTTMPPATIFDDEGTEDTSSQSSTSSTTSPQFLQFIALPPELRHYIWRLAVPSPGINFFNVHCFPNDHVDCNKSTSPPWAYLDLRRLSIDDSDADVSHYDPSTWQARQAVRQSCREARDIATIPASKSAPITLTRPRRGLFVRAGDGQLRGLTPPAPIRRIDETAKYRPFIMDDVEPVVHRTIQVHVDDVLCLSVENCSFNLPLEESPSQDIGWAFDPQLTPPLPAQIPANRVCAGMARRDTFLSTHGAPVFSLLYSHVPEYSEEGEPDDPNESWAGPLLLMFDDEATTQAVGNNSNKRDLENEVVAWDRFDDCYVRSPERASQSEIRIPITCHLTKVRPETNDIRHRFLRSALLHSPKRPVAS
ncbi:hypothetical protein FHL15_005541 [Xylaria flabelliformis]|uniref:2EXR domain-containing protein n=1 Tax=Xylaria flabelliformis TaxID=2512241 RepID=A0A553I033_9PEZI|nr:hypothetical protein FHL15_005541 [Xylaria flabelliformis]